MTNWHKRHISTKWGVLTLGFLLVGLVLLIPLMQKAQDNRSQAAPITCGTGPNGTYEWWCATKYGSTDNPNSYYSQCVNSCKRCGKYPCPVATKPSCSSKNGICGKVCKKGTIANVSCSGAGVHCCKR